MKTLLLLSECLLEFITVSQVKGRRVSYYHDCKFDFIIDITLSITITIKSNCATKCQHHSTDYLNSLSCCVHVVRWTVIIGAAVISRFTLLSVEVSRRVGNCSALFEVNFSSSIIKMYIEYLLAQTLSYVNECRDIMWRRTTSVVSCFRCLCTLNYEGNSKSKGNLCVKSW
jgi:hypothetical protein